MSKEFNAKKNRMYIAVMNQLVRLETEELRRYFEEMEKTLSRESTQWKKWLDEKASGLATADQGDFIEHYIDDIVFYDEVFPNIMRSSMFITCYVLLEANLIRICETLQKRLNTRIKLSDLRDTGIIGASTYLKKVVGVNFPDQTASWNRIADYRRLRNLIVHRRGRLHRDAPDYKRMSQYIEQSADLTLDDYKEISIGRDFIDEVIDTVDEFFQKLYERMRDWNEQQDAERAQE